MFADDMHRLQPGGEGRGSQPRHVSAPGLLFALILPLIYTLLIGPAWLRPWMPPTAYALLGMAVFWFCALGVLLTVRHREISPLATVGLRRMTARGVLLALGIGLATSLLVPLLTMAAALVFPNSSEGGVLDAAARYPVWLLSLGVLTAAVTEEILFRAYPLERSFGPDRSGVVGGLLGLAAFTAVHASGWEPAHVVGVVLPLGIILTVLYLWRREAWFVMIVHGMTDLPLVILALAGSAAG